MKNLVLFFNSVHVTLLLLDKSISLESPVSSVHHSPGATGSYFSISQGETQIHWVSLGRP